MDKQHNEVRLYYIWSAGDKSQSVIDGPVRQQWLKALPIKKKQAILRLLNRESQDRSLLGLQLLSYGAVDMDVVDASGQAFVLADIVYPAGGKPRWQARMPPNFASPEFDFSISHSANLVLTAVSQTQKVGVDAEKIRPLKRLNFTAVMSSDELAIIRSQPMRFFEFWSIKEAVVKAADCAGLSRMRDVLINNIEQEKAVAWTAQFNGKDWYICAVPIHPQFCVMLAASSPINDLSLHPLEINDLL